MSYLDNEILDMLKSINTVMTSTLNQTNQVQYQYGIWIAKRTGKSVTYEYEEIYTGSPGPVTKQFSLQGAGKINYIAQLWNDTTAKDIQVRAYNDASTSYYTLIQNLAGNTSLSELLQLEFFYAMGSRFEFRYENYTNAKIFRIIIQVDYL